MIEKYFMTGVRFKWACPPADPGKTKDGSIIDSPPRPASAMVYDGMDGELYDLSAPHVSTVGLTMRMNIPYEWLVYAHGHTTKLSPTRDVLTGPMSGCLITQWTDQGRRYVGHVGTVESSASVNQKVKTAFAAAMPQNTTGFNPANAWNPGEIAQKMGKFGKVPAVRIMALVTTGGQFYSVLMFELQGGEANRWCCGGAKRVQAMDANALRTALTT
ncbi:MAG: hypothetical protein PVJ02_18610 [Gemmatimonadota bacterium]